MIETIRAERGTWATFSGPALPEPDVAPNPTTPDRETTPETEPVEPGPAPDPGESPLSPRRSTCPMP